jgi:hypothetical protein
MNPQESGSTWTINLSGWLVLHGGTAAYGGSFTVAGVQGAVCGVCRAPTDMPNFTQIATDVKANSAYFAALPANGSVSGTTLNGSNSTCKIVVFNTTLCTSPGCSDWLYGFARYAPGTGRLMVVVANFRPDGAETGRIRLPSELADRAGLLASSPVRLVLDELGAHDTWVGTFSREELGQGGFTASVSRQACNVYAIEG